MLKKATAKHFAFIRSLIIQGAQEGAFDADLAGPLAEIGFFRPLANALDSGRIMLDGRTENLYAYVYFNPAKDKERPLGIALLKGNDSLMEFWMAAIEPAFRKQKLGELMFTEVLRIVDTKNVFARCGEHSERAVGLLKKLGFAHVGTGPEGTQFLVDGRMPARMRVNLQKMFAALSTGADAL